MFESPRYMTVAQAAEQILEAIDSRRKERNGNGGENVNFSLQCYKTMYMTQSRE